MKFSDLINEAANPAQQAAIAISMKKAGKKPKNEASGPKFTGHFKGQDKPPIGKKLVGETIKPFSESELAAILGRPYIIEASAFEKGWDAVKASPGMLAKVTKMFQIFPRIMWDFLSTHAREARQGTQAFGIWAQNQLCKVGRIDTCPTEEQLKWAVSQRSDLGKLVAHFLLITVVSSAVAAGVAHAGVTDAVQNIPFGTNFSSIIAQLNDQYLADNFILAAVIQGLTFILKKSLWETILQGVEYFAKSFNINSIYKFLHNLHPNKDDIPDQPDNQKLNSSVYESIQPGDTVRTKNMSRRGIVESVELYRPFGSLAVYFITEDNQLFRTPIDNVVRIPVSEVGGVASNANFDPVGEYKNYPLYVSRQPWKNRYIAVTEIGREEYKEAGATKEAALAAVRDRIDFLLNAQRKVEASASIDFNKRFVTDILSSPREKFFAKIVNAGGQPKLVIAGDEMLTFGRELAELGFKPSALRIDPENPESTPLPGIGYTKNQISGLGLIANGRYVIGNMRVDNDGNKIFDLKYDSTVHTKSDKLRLNVPALTVGTRRSEA